MIRKFWHFRQIFLTLTATHGRFTLEPMAVCTDTAPLDFFLKTPCTRNLGLTTPPVQPTFSLRRAAFFGQNLGVKFRRPVQLSSRSNLLTPMRKISQFFLEIRVFFWLCKLRSDACVLRIRRHRPWKKIRSLRYEKRFHSF